MNKQQLLQEVKELFRTGSTNKPYQSSHVQFSDSKYPNRFTEEVIIELVESAFKEIEEETTKNVEKGVLAVRDQVLKVTTLDNDDSLTLKVFWDKVNELKGDHESEE